MNFIETLSQPHVYGPLLGGLAILLGLAFAGWKVYYILQKAADTTESETNTKN